MTLTHNFLLLPEKIRFLLCLLSLESLNLLLSRPICLFLLIASFNSILYKLFIYLGEFPRNILNVVGFSLITPSDKLGTRFMLVEIEDLEFIQLCSYKSKSLIYSL